MQHERPICMLHMCTARKHTGNKKKSINAINEQETRHIINLFFILYIISIVCAFLHRFWFAVAISRKYAFLQFTLHVAAKSGYSLEFHKTMGQT